MDIWSCSIVYYTRKIGKICSRKSDRLQIVAPLAISSQLKCLRLFIETSIAMQILIFLLLLLNMFARTRMVQCSGIGHAHRVNREKWDVVKRIHVVSSIVILNMCIYRIYTLETN